MRTIPIAAICGAILVMGIGAGAKPSFDARPAPSYRSIRDHAVQERALVLVAINEGDPETALLPSLPACGGLTAMQRAQKIKNRFTEFTEKRDGWWTQPQMILETGYVRGEVVITWKGQESGHEDFLVTCDTALARSMYTTPTKAAKAVIEMIQGVINPQYLDCSLKGEMKVRIDAMRSQARQDKGQAENHARQGNFAAAIQALRDVLRSAPDYVEANELLLNYVEADKLHDRTSDRELQTLLAHVRSHLPGLRESETLRIDAEEAQEAREFDKAIEKYQQAIDQSKWCVTFYVLKCDACRDAAAAVTGTDEEAQLKKQAYLRAATESVQSARTVAPPSSWALKLLNELLQDINLK